MKIIFVDEHYQLDQINLKARDIIFSLRPDCSYLLEKKNIKFFDYSDFYNHNLEYNNYYNYNALIEKIVKIIDSNFFNYSQNYKNLNWSIFNDFSYVIKKWYDSLLFHSKVLNKIVTDFQPDEFEFSKKTDLNINNDYLIDDNVNIIELLARHNLKIKISYLNKKKQFENNFFFSFGQSKFLKNTYASFLIWKNLINNLKLKYFFKYKRIDYLAIGCDEIFSDSRFKSDFIFNIFPQKSPKNNKLDEDLILTTKKLLKNLEAFKHGEINFYFIFEEIIKFISCRTDFFYTEYKKFNKYLKNKNIKKFIFQSMAPFYYPTFIFRLLAQKNNIPFFTWVHGGYFALSNPGYEVVDYKFCENHIGYGKYLIDLVSNRMTSIQKIYNKNYNVNFVGSFRFDKIHKKSKYKINKKKKIITFYIGCYTNMNTFYYGNNRKDAITSLWRQQLEILKILNYFTNEYTVIVKDYPNGFDKLWKNIIEKEFNNKIKYISNEKKLEQVLLESDLNIFPWISTTFYEALYYESDIFLYDEDLFTEPFQKNFNNEVIWSTNLNDFKNKIYDYLKNGTFKKMTKKKN